MSEPAMSLIKHSKPQRSLGSASMSNQNQGPEDRPSLPTVSVDRDYIFSLFQQQKVDLEQSVQSIIKDEMSNVAAALVTGQQQEENPEEKSTDLHADCTSSQERDENLQTIGEQAEQISSLKEQLDKRDSELAQERQKLGQLRAILVKESPKYIIDNVAVQRFVSLRSQIFKFVKTTYDINPPLINHHIQTQRQKEFFAPFRCEAWRKKYLVNRVCALVFRVVDREILSRAFFGPGGSPDSDEFNASLETLESTFLNCLPRENLKEFVDWRTATIKCGSLFPSSSCTAFNTAQLIWKSLAPIAWKTNASEKGSKLLIKLCEDALTLNTDLRNSRDVFEVRSGFEGPLAAHAEYAEEMASEEIGSHTKHIGKPEDVAFCIFGALVKRTEEDPTKDIVLEKASVAVFRG
ncbi:hypothetical protein F5Y05DRAFT_5478 [Hypoxylon sp. FL0543]|nr:hypothetical protein F5Y05DRAFT_5478 [Hypoxylon sp. FL0543]